MPRCPLCGTAHIVLTVRPLRRGYCVRCDLQFGLDPSGAPASPASRNPERVEAPA